MIGRRIRVRCGRVIGRRLDVGNVGGERGQHRELLRERRQGLLGLPSRVIGAGWVQRVVGGVGDGGWVVLAVRVGMLRGRWWIWTGGVRGVRVGVGVVMGLRMVLVVLVALTSTRRRVATALGIDTRGRGSMGMAIDGWDGVLVLVRGVGGVGKGRGWGRGVVRGWAGVGVGLLLGCHCRCVERRGKGAGRRGERRGRQPAQHTSHQNFCFSTVSVWHNPNLSTITPKLVHHHGRRRPTPPRRRAQQSPRDGRSLPGKSW